VVGAGAFGIDGEHNPLNNLLPPEIWRRVPDVQWRDLVVAGAGSNCAGIRRGWDGQLLILDADPDALDELIPPLTRST
jgi:hypothetical protein